MEGKITSFTDLLVWKKAHILVLEIYKTTKKFPPDEKYRLTDQLRRASVSIMSNIAEGFSRRTSSDKAHFYYNSLGSLSELQSQLLIARDLSYIEITSFEQLFRSSNQVQRFLNGLIKSAQTRPSIPNT